MNLNNKLFSVLRLRRKGLRSFTLVEAVISTVIIGVMFVAAMNVLGATAVAKRSTEQQALGYSLAQDLMNEILNQPYEDPDQTAEFGRESGESGGDREDFDDVDTYKIAVRTVGGLYDGVTTAELDQLSIQTSVGFIAEDPI